MEFSSKDKMQMEAKGISLQQVEDQIANFRNGFPFLNIDRVAVVSDGIVHMDSYSMARYATLYNDLKQAKEIVKFVPASGAATRMFKELFEFVDQDKPSAVVDTLLENIDTFAFAQVLHGVTAGATPKELVGAIIKTGLEYGSKPKALILFHKYPDGNRTALEEHLVEGAMYAEGRSSQVNIHYTVSPEHLKGFEQLVSEVIGKYEKRYHVTYNISYSQQKSSTDTLAVTQTNEPFRESDGTLLFRPAGHGALLSNLQDIDADLIFIKTVDNVAPDALKADTVKYKQVIGGLLLSLQECCFDYLHRLDNNRDDEALVEQVVDFIETALHYRLPEKFAFFSHEEQWETVRRILNRPIRVCGMVKNEGEPGGGPFWVKGSDGELSLQIAESSQIAPEQKSLMTSATHFNPVDLVCGTRNYRGEKFCLSDFVDPTTGFISEKSKDGKQLKAQELPGLWNGAMANWNTIFVEVPISTFSPVKTVNDLLRPQHAL